VVQNDEICYSILKRCDFAQFPEFEEVNTISLKVHQYLQKDGVRQQIAKTHALGASSHEIESDLRER